MQSSNYLISLLFLCFYFGASHEQGLFNLIGDVFHMDAGSQLPMLKKYDFIVIGAGSSGSVLASRLSEYENWKILLLEAGDNENFFTDIPLMAAVHSSTSYNWGYKSEQSNTSCLSLIDGRCRVSRGKALGGTSTINFLVYTRGNKLDYDDWKRQGNDGWGYQDILPYFKKSENCSFEVVVSEDEYRGRKGYVNVQQPPYHTPLPERFLNAGSQFGYKNTDPNGRFHLGFSKVQATMYNGRRKSAAKAYLTPVKTRRNLRIVTRATVSKVLVDPKSKRAYGVEFIKNGKKYVIKANKEVLVSAGTTNSPQLLMLSGIGPREDLEKLNIHVLQNLKVGYNLQDHVSFAYSFLINDTVTISDLNVQTPSNVFNYVVHGKGPLTLPGGAEAVAFIKSNHSENRKDDYPDLELVLGAAGLNNDFFGFFRRAIGVSNSLFHEIYGSVMFDPAFSITTVLLKPRSRGRVWIKSSNPLDAPAIDLNYFQDESDVQVMVDGLKMAKVVGQSQSFQKYDAKVHNIIISPCKAFSPGTFQHEACLLRNLASSLGHLVGTCKMGPRQDPEAVVDPQLRVHGIGGLRVIDASIMPNIVTGHTNSVAMMIAEKAADMIKSEWKRA